MPAPLVNQLTAVTASAYVCPVIGKATWPDLLICLGNLTVERPKEIWPFLGYLLLLVLVTRKIWPFGVTEARIKRLSVVAKTFQKARKAKRPLKGFKKGSRK